MDRSLSPFLSERSALQSDLTQCRTHAERVKLFQKHILTETDRIRASYASGDISALTEFSGRTSEWIEFLLKEAFWWVFEETTVVCCTHHEQVNARKDAALFWRLSPLEAVSFHNPTLDLFLLFCEAPTDRQAQFLTRFYVEFANNLQELLAAEKIETNLFRVKVTITPAFDFIRTHFSKNKDQFSERIAWLKLKSIAGSTSVKEEVERAREAYVFSQQPIHFSDAALERVQSQPRVSGQPDVRLSAGGLLDIEYLTAVLQFAYGREVLGDIRSPDTLTALYGLRQAGALGEKPYQDLRAAYVFLTGLAGVLECTSARELGTQLPQMQSEAYLLAARRMGYRGPDSHAHAEFRLACQHHMSGADRLYSTLLVNLASQPWEEIPNTIVVSQDSVRVRLDDLLRGEPRPEDVPALRRMGFSQIDKLGRRFQELCPNRTAFEPFSRVIEKSWVIWPEVPSPDLALENLKSFADKNEDSYRFWYALAKSDKGLRLLLRLFGTSRILTKLFLEHRETWAWVEQTQFLGVSQTLDLLQKPDISIQTWEAVKQFKDREVLRLAMTDLFMGEPFDCLMEASGRLMVFTLGQWASFLPEPGNVALIGLGGTGSSASLIESERSMAVVVREESFLTQGRQWLEVLMGGVGGGIWGWLSPSDKSGESSFLFTRDSLLNRLKQAALLSQASPWLQMMPLAGALDLSREVQNDLRETWRSGLWLESAAFKKLMAEREETLQRLESRHESERHLVLAPGGIRDIEWVVTAAWSRRARENFQPCGLLEMLDQVASSGILPDEECAQLKESFIGYQKIRTRLGFAFSPASEVLPADGEEFRIVAKAAGFQDRGIHSAETFLKQRLAQLRQNAGAIFDRFFQEVL